MHYYILRINILSDKRNKILIFVVCAKRLFLDDSNIPGGWNHINISWYTINIIIINDETKGSLRSGLGSLLNQAILFHHTHCQTES